MDTVLFMMFVLLGGIIVKLSRILVMIWWPNGEICNSPKCVIQNNQKK